MANNIIGLSTADRAQLIRLIEQTHEANEKRYVAKTPVADLAELKAITAPEEGEQRQILGYPTFTMYVYNSVNASPDEVCDDGSAGGWTNTTPPSAPEFWVADFDYVANDMFLIEVDTDMVDHEGNEIVADELYVARYVDSSGAAADTTSGTTLDAAEVAKMEVVHGQVPSVLEISQADTDAIILAN